MGSAMAVSAERDEIFARVVSEFASCPDVMDFQVLGATTLLAAPTVSY